MSVKVYVEGGGNRNQALVTECRRRFKEFFEHVGLSGRLPRVVPSGGRQQADKDFCSAVANPQQNVVPLLLVDSETPIQQGGPWGHLKQRAGDGWDQPSGATDEHVHLMVQCMEAWFLADRESLERYYGDGFHPNALRAWTNVEVIPKADVMNALRSATRDCPTKGEYSKGQHSFEILRQIDPAKIRAASPHADRLLNTLDRLCGSE